MRYLNMNQKLAIAEWAERVLSREPFKKPKGKNIQYVYNAVLINFLKSKKLKYHVKNKNYKGIYSSFHRNSWEIDEWINLKEERYEEFCAFVKNFKKWK